MEYGLGLREGISSHLSDDLSARRAAERASFVRPSRNPGGPHGAPAKPCRGEFHKQRQISSPEGGRLRVQHWEPLVGFLIFPHSELQPERALAHVDHYFR